ncbi:MAG: hypothetical protein U0401_25125 [Anaerolineae bacterium]
MRKLIGLIILLWCAISVSLVQAQEGGQEYTVRAGDIISGLAEDFLGDVGDALTGYSIGDQ